jgi:hypothetical protein
VCAWGEKVKNGVLKSNDFNTPFFKHAQKNPTKGNQRKKMGHIHLPQFQG